MNDGKLERRLNSVGKKAFVDFFELYQAYAEGRISRDKCIKMQVEKGVSNRNGASIRCSNDKAIFVERHEREALEIISTSTHVSSDTVSKAKKLLTL